MRVSVTENWFEGVRKDQRALAMTKDYETGDLLITTRKGWKVATFTRYQGGRNVDVLPPLWRVEVVQIDDLTIQLAGLQRLSARAPLHFQEWSCLIRDRKP